MILNDECSSRPSYELDLRRHELGTITPGLEKRHAS
jgi:hypothetical protein